MTVVDHKTGRSAFLIQALETAISGAFSLRSATPELFMVGPICESNALQHPNRDTLFVDSRTNRVYSRRHLTLLFNPATQATVHEATTHTARLRLVVMCPRFCSVPRLPSSTHNQPADLLSSAVHRCKSYHTALPRPELMLAKCEHWRRHQIHAFAEHAAHNN